jgi:hypothetical protein
MGQIVGPETLLSNFNQALGTYPKEDNFQDRYCRAKD